MARVIIDENHFDEAREKLASIGIILYRRKHSKGGYVCRASRTMRESIARVRALKELPKDDLFIHGAL